MQGGDEVGFLRQFSHALASMFCRCVSFNAVASLEWAVCAVGWTPKVYRQVKEYFSLPETGDNSITIIIRFIRMDYTTTANMTGVLY